MVLHISETLKTLSLVQHQDSVRSEKKMTCSGCSVLHSKKKKKKKKEKKRKKEKRNAAD
jgi:hypothetical protein